MDDVAQPDAVQPFLRARARPARHHQAQRRSVHRVQGLAILGKRDQHVVGHRLGNRHAARDRDLVGIAGKVRVGAIMGGVDNIRLDPGGLQNILQSHAGPLRTGDSAIGPLIALGRRVEEGATVAAALNRQRHRHDFELRLEIGDRIGRRIVDEAVDRQRPGVGVHLLRRDAVIADEMPHRRGDGVIQQMRRRLGIDRPVVQQGQAVLADQHVLAGEGGGDEPRGHVAMKRDHRTDHRRHGGQPGSLQEAAAVGMRLPAEECAIRRDRVAAEKFMHVRMRPDRVTVLWHDVLPVCPDSLV